jgi:hypothetical protein
MFPAAIEIKSSKLSKLKGDDPLYHRYAVEYYNAWFNTLLDLSTSMGNYGRTILLNRGHLSEFVYSQLYRNYSADFVWPIERRFIKLANEYQKIFLITLTDNHHSLLQRDDGLSVSKNGKRDVAKEQDLFKLTFHKSVIQRKIHLDIRGLSTDQVADRTITFIDKNLYRY